MVVLFQLSPHQPGVSFSKRSESGLRVGDPQRSPALSEERKELCVLLERKEAERDGSHRCLPRRSAAEEDQQQKFVGDADEEVMESTRRSSSIWGSLEIDLNSYPNKGEHIIIVTAYGKYLRSLLLICNKDRPEIS